MQDECLVHNYELQTMNEVKTPRHGRSTSFLSAGKVIPFWDAKSIMYIGYLQKVHTIN